MVDLTEFDALASPGPVVTRIRPESVIPNGYFTVTFPDGGHRTFRISTQPEKSKFAPGKRIVGMLIGPDNTDDYERFAFCDDDGIHVWKSKQRGTKYVRYAQFIWLLATGQDVVGDDGEVLAFELQVSKRCLRCNRTLTTPESIERGLGEECWKRVNA